MDFRLQDGLTLQEVLDIVESNDIGDFEDIFIEPPEPNVLTDEDSGNEDDGGPTSDLSARQLTAGAEIRFRREEVFENIEDEQSQYTDKFVEENIDFEMPEVNKTTNWVRGDFETPDSTFPSTDFSQYSHLTPVEMFELFFDDKLISHLVEQSKLYALFKNFNDFDLTKDEIKCFIGILILSGYNVLPGKWFYWDSSTDMGNLLAKDAMRRDRFINIMRFMHCANNYEINKNDKVWKLRPIMKMLKGKFLDHFNPSQNLNYDESMIKYFGKHGCKQFIRGKPIRFGYKVWCLNTPDGYLVNFDFYQGISPTRNTVYENIFGKCTAPLIKMIDEFPLEKKKTTIQILF